jgi:hypothetical protein
MSINEIAYTDLAEGQAMLRDIVSSSTKVEELDQFDNTSIEPMRWVGPTAAVLR